MTTPTRISAETVNGRIYTIDRALFVTPRGGCGIRFVHRIDRKRVSRDGWMAQREIDAGFDRVRKIMEA
jgi:hypothetical protein